MSEDNRPAFRQGLEKIERAFKDNKPFAERDKLFVSLPLPHPPHLETDINPDYSYSLTKMIFGADFKS